MHLLRTGHWVNYLSYEENLGFDKLMLPTTSRSIVNGLSFIFVRA